MSGKSLYRTEIYWYTDQLRSKYIYHTNNDSKCQVEKYNDERELYHEGISLIKCVTEHTSLLQVKLLATKYDKDTRLLTTQRHSNHQNKKEKSDGTLISNDLIPFDIILINQ